MASATQIPPVESLIEELAAKAGSASLNGHGPVPTGDSEANGGGGSQNGSLTPELPPALAALRNKTTQEILADLNKSPLFMTELEENDDVAALQALAYEGTPLENASDFKERGNECHRDHKWRDANEFYTKGINILAAEFRRRTCGEPPAALAGASSTENSEKSKPTPLSSDDPEEIKREAATLEQLYVNRAACHLKLRNYRSCTLDCASTLGLNPRNIKAFYRSSQALLRLDKVLEAEDAIARGLTLDPDNTALQAVRADVAERRRVLGEKKRAEEERAATEARRRYLLRETLRQRGVKTRKTDKPPEMEDARCQLAPDPDDPESTLAFPTMILYPADMQSDFIKAFGEGDCMDVHLSYLLPLPWDRDSAYTQSGVECYVETAKGTLVKLGKKVPLIKVLSMDNMEVVDELVRIFVLPKTKAAKWVKDFKAMKAGIAVAA